MGNILIVAIVFIGFSMSMSWVVGHKERSDLSEQLEATEVSKRDMQQELVKVGQDLKEESGKIKELTEALQSEKEERAKAEEALIQREAQLKAAKENLNQSAQTDGGRGAVTAEEKQRQAEAAEQLKREEEARQEAESILLQTELDRVMAEESLLKKAEELAIVKAELALLESISGVARLADAELGQKTVDEGEGGQAVGRAEEALKARLVVMRKEEIALTGDVKNAALLKEEIEYRLEQERLLKLEEGGEISAEDREVALDRASMKHIKPFSIEGIFGYATTESDEGGQEWWKKRTATYRVKREDESLAAIAAKESIYSNRELWVVIYMSNLDKVGAPDFMDAGQQLMIPKIITRGEIREKIRAYYSREVSERGIESNDQAPEESVPLRQSET
ncbi:MAG: hypothetical protein ACE5D4_00480 [Thermodesulfobacteriota bacterium]